MYEHTRLRLQGETFMADRITLVVQFRLAERVKQEFLEKLQDVFKHIVKEESFVWASLVHDMREPKSVA
jgi:quinol monooxygenase YgiN